MPTQPEYASEATPILEAVAQFEAEGFAGQFGVREAGRLICFACREESAPADVALHALIRTEGASDPDDMTAVAALVCPRCDSRGTVILKFGPEAPSEESIVLTELEDRRIATGTDAAGG